MKKIMVTEDDTYIGNLLEEALSGEGYQVLRAYSGTEALLVLEKERPDLILLDLMLPGLSGEELFDRIRDRQIPVIVVSAKTGTEDKVKLLLGGASDYVTKPFVVKELLARIIVCLRQAQMGQGQAGQVLEAGDLVMDLVSHEVRIRQAGGAWPEDIQPEPPFQAASSLADASWHTVALTKTEFAILKLLLLHAGQALSKSVILDRISQETPDCTDSSLKQHVSNLRRKLRQAGGREYIESVWGIGFKLREYP